MTESARTYALLASSHESGEYLTLTVRAVSVDPGDGGPRNLRTDETYSTDPMAGITITAQADRSEDRPYAYAWRLGIRTDDTMPLGQVAAVLGTLRALDRKLSALSDRIGPAATFGGYVARVADALGIQVMTGRTGSDGMYSSGQWNLWTAGDSVSVIDGWIAGFRAVRS